DQNSKLQHSDFKNTCNRKVLIEKIVQNINNSSTLLVQKTTGLGATTSLMVTALWYLIFKPDTRIVIVSPSYSSKNFTSDARRLYLKTLNVYRNLYPLPYLHQLTYQSRCQGIRYFSIENHERNSAIVFISSSKPVDLAALFPEHEGLKYKAVFFDEFAFHKHADAMWNSLEGYKIARIAVSSANGMSNLFYELVSSHKHKLHTMHWFHEPSCDEQWYLRQCLNNHPAWVEQYINIDYNFKFQLRKAQKNLTENQITLKTLIKSSKVLKTYYERNKKPRCINKNTVQSLLIKRKPHRNPKNVLKPSNYSAAIYKFITVASNKPLKFDNKTIEAVKKHKLKISINQPRIFKSLPVATCLIYYSPDTKPERLNFLNNKNHTFKLLEFSGHSITTGDIASVIHHIKHRLTA
ncbi:MAG: hypothetical protein AB1782_13615, partial [Cyanobacteriota bacterium]